MIKLRWDFKNQQFKSEDASSYNYLLKTGFGEKKGQEVYLKDYEAFYLHCIRNAKLLFKKKKIGIYYFLRLNPNFSFKTYVVYKDLKEKAIKINEKIKKAKDRIVKIYRAKKLGLPRKKIQGYLIDNFVICEKGKQYYDKTWFGQWGSYKYGKKGKGLKLDLYEAQYLIERKRLKIVNHYIKNLIKKSKQQYYSVFKHWRDLGIIIKTGFKFGADFRIYLEKSAETWQHSKHVVWVFPKNKRMYASEWARAIRVAHSVRKTFVLVINKETGKQKHFFDFSIVHNEKHYALKIILEEEIIDSCLIYSLYLKARKKGLTLIVALVDRESAVTYYRISEIKTSKRTDNVYLEVEWFNL